MHKKLGTKRSYAKNRTMQFFFDLNRFVYFFGLPSFWTEGLDLPEHFVKFFNKVTKISNLCVFVLVLLEYGAFITQHHLSAKQTSDLLLYCTVHAVITYFRVRLAYQTDDIRDVTYKLGVALKEVHNDLEVEERMVKKSKLYSGALVMICLSAALLYTRDACMEVLRAGATFNTVVTAWPDVRDPSLQANILRTVLNIFWWIYLTRVFSVYALVICLTCCTSHQYTNLQSYFLSLNDIFKGDGCQDAKEEQYEQGVKTGIRMHSDTLGCTDQIQAICRDVFSGQIFINLIVLVMQMYHYMTSERTLTDVITVVTAALTVLMSTGFFMWNAGDITAEAGNLPNTMYSSGWENCSGASSVRVRSLLVIAMNRAQQPVVLKGLGVIELSYSSYVSIVKSSYSVFSVIY